MLTFAAPQPNGPPQTGGRRKDSAAASILKADLLKDYRHEAHLSTKQPCARSSSRFPPAHVNCCWPQHIERSPCAWSQKAVGLKQNTMPDRATCGYTVMRKRSDFLAANRGKRYATPGFVLLIFDRRDDDPAKRLGITITKKVGNAVIRNRMRRRFRALAMDLLGDMGKAGADHVLIGRDRGIERDFAELRAEMVKALGKLCNSCPSGEGNHPKDGGGARA
jgi:ribonuclease P protein component